MTKHQCKHCKDCRSDEEQCVHKLRVRKLKACDAYINDLHAKKICANSVTTDELNVPNFISLEKYGPNPPTPGCDCPSGIDTVPRIRLQQNVVANKNTTVNGQLCVKGNTTLCDVDVQNDLHVMGNETVDGTSTFNGAATFNDTLTANGAAVFNDTLTANGTTTFNGEVIFTNTVIPTVAPPLLTVDPTFVNPNGITEFHTVEEAVNSLKVKTIVPPVTIKLAEGVHDNIIITDFERSVQASGLTSNLDQGVKIIGDERRIIGQAYIDSVINVSAAQVPDVVITTNIPGVGPYNATPANFGGFPIPSIVKPGVLSQNAGAPPVSDQAIAPILNGAAINGNIGICRRGTIGFNQKAVNLEAVGAVAMICINNAPGNGTLVMASAGLPTTIPSVMVGLNDGNALLAAITSNPGLIITIASSSPNLYTPAFGTFAGNVDLSHPGGNLSKLDVVITSAPTAQLGRPASAIGIENPNFADPALGPVVPGDTVTVVLNSGASVVQTIASLEESVPGSGYFNRLVFTTPLPSPADNADSSITFRSKVLCRSTDIQLPALRVLTSNVLLQGITFTIPSFIGTGAQQAYITTSTVLLSNVSFEDPTLQYNTGLTVTNSKLVGLSSNRQEEVPITFVSHSTSISATSSIMELSTWYILGGRATGQGANLSHDAGFSSGTLIIALKNAPVGVRADALTAYIDSYILHISGASTGVTTANPSDGTFQGRISITAEEYFSIVRNGVGLSLGRDDTVSTPLFEGSGPATFANNTVRDFELRNSAKLIVLGPNIIFSGDQTYRVLDSSELNVDNTLTFAPNGVRTYTASGSIDHALNEHCLDGAGVLNMTMAPSASTRLYLGREYIITDSTGGFKHTITLTGGAQFFGNGFNGSTTLTFSGVKGDSVTLFVKDATTVFVVSPPSGVNTISVPTIFGGADLSKPTIQEAINFFTDNNVSDGKILVAPGTYFETLKINKISSGLSSNTKVYPYNGFTIRGDTRRIGGITYLQNGYNTNQENLTGFGTNYAPVTLVDGPNTIQVTGVAGLNFTTMGLVVGDKIKIRDNSGAVSDRNITVVGTDTLTYDGSDLTVGGKGSSLVLCPNVQIFGTTSDDVILYMSGASLVLEGVWFNSSLSGGSAANLGGLAYFGGSGTNVCLLNCLFDSATGNIKSGFPNLVVANEANLTASRYQFINDFAPPAPNGPSSGSSSTNAFIGSSRDMIVVSQNAVIFLGNWNFLSSSGNAFGVFMQNGAQFDIADGVLQHASQAGGAAVNATNGSQAVVTRFVVLNTQIGFQASGNSTLRLGQSAFTSTIDSTGTASFVGIAINRGSYGRIESNATINISNVGTGISVIRSGTFTVEAASSAFVFTNVTAANIHTENLSVWNGMQQTSTPGNVFTYTAAPGAQEMENAYQNQIINTASPINLPLNPSATASGTLRKYLGKTFTVSLSNAGGVGSTITLAGASFTGFSASGNVATFTAVNSSVTFLVESTTTVRVLSSFGITYP